MSRSKPVKEESPSKKLRDVFYTIWLQDPEGYEEFDDYYDIKMHKLIDHYKRLIKNKIVHLK